MYVLHGVVLFNAKIKKIDYSESRSVIMIILTIICYCSWTIRNHELITGSFLTSTMTISNFIKQKTNYQYRNNRFTYMFSLQCKCINKPEKLIWITSYVKKMYKYTIFVFSFPFTRYLHPVCGKVPIHAAARSFR